MSPGTCSDGTPSFPGLLMAPLHSQGSFVPVRLWPTVQISPPPHAGKHRAITAPVSAQPLIKCHAPTRVITPIYNRAVRSLPSIKPPAAPPPLLLSLTQSSSYFYPSPLEMLRSQFQLRDLKKLCCSCHPLPRVPGRRSSDAGIILPGQSLGGSPTGRGLRV